MTAPAPLDLASLRAAVDAMTPGPWRAFWYGADDTTIRIPRDDDPTWPGDPVAFVGANVSNQSADAHGIVALRNAAPALLSHATEAAALRAENERLCDRLIPSPKSIAHLVGAWSRAEADRYLAGIAGCGPEECDAVVKVASDAGRTMYDAIAAQDHDLDTARAAAAAFSSCNRARQAAEEECVRLRAEVDRLSAAPDRARLENLVLGLMMASENVALDNGAAAIKRRDDAERVLLSAVGFVPDRTRIVALVDAYGEAKAAFALEDECGSCSAKRADASLALDAARTAVLAAMGVEP